MAVLPAACCATATPTIQGPVEALPNPGSALSGARAIMTGMFLDNRFSRQHLPQMERKLPGPFIAGYLSSAALMMPGKVGEEGGEEGGERDQRLSCHAGAAYCKRIADAGYPCYHTPRT